MSLFKEHMGCEYSTKLLEHNPVAIEKRPAGLTELETPRNGVRESQLCDETVPKVANTV